jgi:hypothetical protein
MADSKITALTALTAADPVNDMFPVVDVSDTTMAASGTTKKISVNNILSSSPTASGALTVTGLVTAGSATITGALTVDTTTLVVDATNDRVGIGKASPGYKLVVAAATGNVMQFENTSDSDRGGRITNTGTAGTGKFGLTTTSSGYGLSFGIDAVEKMLLDTSGNLGVGVTPAGTGGCLQLKSGITFPATQVASSDANTLDDYEEGTWTGTLTGGTTNPTIPVTATGLYTKIGRQVTVAINFNNVITTGASGTANITGLPFTNNASTSYQGSLLSETALTFTGSPFSFIEVSTTVLQLRQNISNASASNCTHNAGTGRYIQATLTYTV